MFTGMQYSGKNDTLYLDFSSHSSITGGTYELTRGEQPDISCEPVTEKSPLEYCETNSKLF